MLFFAWSSSPTPQPNEKTSSRKRRRAARDSGERGQLVDGEQQRRGREARHRPAHVAAGAYSGLEHVREHDEVGPHLQEERQVVEEGRKARDGVLRTVQARREAKEVGHSLGRLLLLLGAGVVQKDGALFDERGGTMEGVAHVPAHRRHDDNDRSTCDVAAEHVRLPRKRKDTCANVIGHEENGAGQDGDAGA